ncbi:hypothetical protein FGIG_06844 [Fasciola gigantica]|uniref:Uncharacterized protein n=1 Tax=Fasciola gigantica TaxID=46835 RepID=A0A504YPW0_FASGI|nr:hypothetical protein FGIG_06844 [Fasciola gigantica]
MPVTRNMKHQLAASGQLHASGGTEEYRNTHLPNLANVEDSLGKQYSSRAPLLGMTRTSERETMISLQPHLTDTELKFVGTSKPARSPKVYLPMILLDSREPSCRFRQCWARTFRPHAQTHDEMKYTTLLPTEATLCSKISGMFVLEFEEEHRDNSALSLEDNAATKIVTDSATVAEVRCHFHLPWGRDRRDLSNISLLSEKQMRHIMKKAGWAGARGYGENLHGTDTTERLVQVMRNYSDGKGRRPVG